MLKTSAFAVALILSAGAAQAQWQWNGAEGVAQGAGSGGIAVAVDCGNGDLPGVSIRNYRREIENPVLVVSVDGGAESLIPTDCFDGICNLQFETEGEARQLIGALQRGRRLELGLYRMGALSEVSLRGSGAAIRRVLQSCG